MSMRDTLLAALVPYGQALHLMMEHTGSQLQATKAVMERARFDAEESERLINQTAASLQSLVTTAARIELITCRPSSPEVCTFVEETTGALRQMAGSVAFCRALTRAADAKKLKPRELS